MTAQELFNKAFPVTRDPRSKEYKAGVLAALKFRLKETPSIDCPYKIGSTQFDAFFYGLTEGHSLGREYHNCHGLLDCAQKHTKSARQL